MTNELEKQFFDTFGIEPYDRYLNCTENLEVDCNRSCNCCDKAEDVYYYPEITDHILLGIIAKIMWSYSCTQNDFDAYEVHTVDNLKEAVLRHAIELSKNDAYVYWGVRTLFEEG